MFRGLFGGLNTGAEGSGEVSRVRVVDRCGKVGRYVRWSSTTVSSEENVFEGIPW